MNKKKVLQVVMLGAGLNVMGGISSVEKLIIEQGIPEVNLKHISTLEDGLAAKKILVFQQAIFNHLCTLFKKKADLFHIHFASKGSTLRTTILILITLAFRKPIILHSHGAGFHIFYANLPSWARQIINHLFSKCSRLIVLSNSWKKFYIENLNLAENKIVVLPNPVKLPLQIEDTKDSNTIRFLFLGRIGKRKGAFELIKAFAEIPTQHRDRACLTLAGDGEAKQARELVEALGLMDRITILDWVNSQERDALLTESNVFVLPSHNEGLPMAMIEAMSFGLPIITTPVGGIPELISHENNGLLIEPGNIQQLSSAMQSLIENELMRNSLGIKAEQSVASLNIQKYCLSLKSVYQELV